jgi:hypothetical protein
MDRWNVCVGRPFPRLLPWFLSCEQRQCVQKVSDMAGRSGVHLKLPVVIEIIIKMGVNGDATESFRVNLWSENELESFNYGKRLVIYIHLQQILICCTAYLQAPSISGYFIDISSCSIIVSNIILQDYRR